MALKTSGQKEVQKMSTSQWLRLIVIHLLIPLLYWFVVGILVGGRHGSFH